MKLTRKQAKELRDILYHAKRAQAYILADDIAVCRKVGTATTSLHFTRPLADMVLFDVEKAIGSDLCGLPQATAELERWIERNSNP